MADNDFYTPQIDYRSRDYAAIRDDMLGLIPNFAPQWTSRDASDFGIVMIEMFAYMGDILNYYIDRAANESFLSTATQRETVLNIARLLNYTPNPSTAAEFSLTFANTSTSAAVTIKNGAVFGTDPDATGNQIFFEYVGSDFSTGTSPTTVTATVKHGVSTSVAYVSDGSPDQTFAIQPPVIPATISAVVGSVTYDKVDNLIDYGPADTKFSTYYDGNDVVYVRFGDGQFGKIPPSGPITISYRAGGGVVGNVGATTITNFISNMGTNYAGVSVVNPSTAGVLGTDVETTESIRVNAASSLRTMNRAVSLSDYANLAVQTTNQGGAVDKANAVAETYNSIILFVASRYGLFNTFTDIYNYFIDKTPPGTSLTIANYTPAYPAVTLSIKVAPTASQSETKISVEAAIADLFSFDNVTFNDSISPSDIYKTVMNVPNVIECNITAMSRNTTASPANGTPATMNFYVNEVPIYDLACVSVTAEGGV